MNGNFKGMDPDLARNAMALISDKKVELDSESAASSSAISERIAGAFAGAQTEAMQNFVERLNAALQNLYKYLDGAESNFASKFNEVIKSYEDSDINVSQSYSNITFE